MCFTSLNVKISFDLPPSPFFTFKVVGIKILCFENKMLKKYIKETYMGSHQINHMFSISKPYATHKFTHASKQCKICFAAVLWFIIFCFRKVVLARLNWSNETHVELINPGKTLWDCHHFRDNIHCYFLTVFIPFVSVSRESLRNWCRSFWVHAEANRTMYILHMFHLCSTCALHTFRICSAYVPFLFHLSSAYVLHIFRICLYMRFTNVFLWTYMRLCLCAAPLAVYRDLALKTFWIKITYFLTFFVGHIIWHFIFFYRCFFDISPDLFPVIFSDIVSGIPCDILSDISCDIFSGIFSGVLSWHISTFLLTLLLTYLPAYCLIYFLTFFLNLCDISYDNFFWQEEKEKEEKDNSYKILKPSPDKSGKCYNFFQDHCNNAGLTGYAAVGRKVFISLTLPEKS